MFPSLICVLVLLALICVGVNSDEIRKKNKDDSAGNRNFVSTKRGVITFGLMISCATGRSAFDFIGYGCWCGIGGKGNPVDNLDKCCQAHDWCYERIIASKVCPFNFAKYVMPYSRRSCSTCEPASYYWFFGKCRHALCECDATAAKCFKNNHFNERYRSYSQKNC